MIRAVILATLMLGAPAMAQTPASSLNFLQQQLAQVNAEITAIGAKSGDPGPEERKKLSQLTEHKAQLETAIASTQRAMAESRTGPAPAAKAH